MEYTTPYTAAASAPLNLDTGVVELIAGKAFGDVDELACATLG
jgi:hypothetical protein